MGLSLNILVGAVAVLAAISKDAPDTLIALVVTLFVASFFFNWLYRLIVFAVAYALVPQLPYAWASGLLFLAVFNVPTFELFGIRPKQPKEGVVFVTG